MKTDSTALFLSLRTFTAEKENCRSVSLVFTPPDSSAANPKVSARAPGTKKLTMPQCPSPTPFLWFTPNPVRGFHLGGIKKKRQGVSDGVDNRRFRYLESEKASTSFVRTRYIRGDRRECDIYFPSAKRCNATRMATIR